MASALGGVQFGNRARNVLHSTTERGAAARERLTAALEVAKDTQRRLQSAATEGAKKADRLVRDNPYHSVGIAFGLGILMGLLANRR